jgi:hypothetical protein
MNVWPAVNATAEIQAANNYPNIRVFTVGQGTTSYTPLNDLVTVSQPWVAASNTSIGAGNWTEFRYATNSNPSVHTQKHVLLHMVQRCVLVLWTRLVRQPRWDCTCRSYLRQVR